MGIGWDYSGCVDFYDDKRQPGGEMMRMNEYLAASEIKIYLDYQSADFSAKIERVRFLNFIWGYDWNEMQQWKKAKEIIEKINSQIAYDTRAKEVSKILNAAIGGTQPLSIERWAVNKVKTMWEEILEKEEKEYKEQFCKQEGIAP